MKIRWATLPMLAVLLLFGALGAACGSSDDPGTGDPGPPAVNGGGDADNGEGNGNGGSGSASATLTIGDESWTFDAITCLLSPGEAGNNGVSFQLSSFGETADGVRTQIDVSILDTQETGRYEGDGTVHSISLIDVEDLTNPSVHWSAMTGMFGGAEWTIQVNGKHVTAEATFDDGRTDREIEKVPGSLVGTCP